MRSGDKCSCGGTYNVYTSKRSADEVVRYLRCTKCGSTAKQLIPAIYVRRRAVAQ